MANAVIYAIASVIIVSLLSLIGIFALFVKEKILNKILLYLVSFAAGALLGDAFIHLIPEAFEETKGIAIPLFILSGIIISFIVEKYIQWHHCHHLGHHHSHHAHQYKPFAYVNLIGDGIHNFIDGLIIGGSYLVSIPIGIATTLAVILHEIPQEIGDFGILIHAGFSRMKALFYNFMSAAVAIIGTIIALSLGNIIKLTEFLIPFTAGAFIYIAAADLIPELHKTTDPKKSFYQLMAFLIGIGMMFALVLVE